jgi:hypothetical protein
MIAPAPQESDAGHDIGDHPHASIGAGGMISEIDEGGGRHQDVGPQARAALPVLAFGADQRSSTNATNRLTRVSKKS